MRSTNVAAALVAALVAGCFAPPGDPVAPGGDAGEPRDAALQPVPPKSLEVDFGNVAVGERVERRVTIRNEGASELQATEIQLGAIFDDAFSAQFAPMTLQPGQSGEFSLFFKPTTTGARVADLVVVLRGGQAPQLVAHLKGTGFDPGCTVEPGESLEFGTAAAGELRVRQVRIVNGSNTDWSITIGALQGSIDAFEFGAGFTPGAQRIAAHSAFSIPVMFRPGVPGSFQATFAIAASAACSASTVTLRGAAIDQVVTWQPSAIAFGYVHLGQRVQAKVVLRNAGDREVSISHLAVHNAPGGAELFRLETSERLFALRGGEQREFAVSFAPQAAGAATGTVTFATDAFRPTSGTIALTGFGGGPDIDAPAKAEFGQVATGAFQIRSVTVSNAGSDLPGTSDDNLLFALRDPAGGWAPRIPEVESATGEFRLEPVALPGSGLAAGEKVAFRVKFAPTTSGPKQATLTLYSNDPDEPERVVALTGEAVVMPPCDFDVLPSQLDYGTVEAGRTLTLNFQIRNQGANECRISQLDLDSGSAAAFDLPNGPVANATVAAGSTLAVPVRFAPTQGGDFVGGVRFYSSSTTAPETLVTLSARSAPNCLLAAAPAVEFGLIPTSCASKELTVLILNVCAALTIDTLELANGTSPEIAITQKPSVPTSVAAGATFEVKLRYRPNDAGMDVSTLVIKAGQLERVLPVSGSSSATAVQEDEFVQDSRPRVDVLFVVDDSTSMSDKQNALGNNFRSFMQTATARQVDYQIAVTTTSVDVAHGNVVTNANPPDANGRFVPLSATIPRILTPSTPSLAQAFSQNVKVGTNGNYSEMLIRPAYLALTAPNIQLHNAGFLRPDANLAVIIVSDAEDYDVVPVSFYRNFLAALKPPDRKVTVSGFVPTLPRSPGTCSYDEPNSSVSTRTRDLITQTGGIFEEICNSSWSTALGRIGDVAFGGPRLRFLLSNTPDLTAPMTIEIDGQPYAPLAANGETRWTYSPAANCIDFDPAYIPVPGARIAVSYLVACLP